MKPLTKNKEILEMKEQFPEFTSFAQAMGNAGRKVKRPLGKSLFYKSDIAQALELLKKKVNWRRKTYLEGEKGIRRITELSLIYEDILMFIDECFPAFTTTKPPTIKQ